MSIFELIMLLCFGAAWPFSIYKGIKSGSTAGKSPVFLIILLVGYVAGILNKLLNHNDFVVYFYVLNFVMVSVDLAVYIRNKRRAAHK